MRVNKHFVRKHLSNYQNSNLKTILHLLDFLLDFRTPFFFLLSLSLRLSLLSSISELAMLSGSLLLSLPPVLSWSTTPLQENILQILENISQSVSEQYFSPSDCSHACDGGFAEQPFVFFEFPVSFVGSNARLCCRQVPVPTTDDVSGFEIGLVVGKNGILISSIPVLVSIFEVTAFKSIDLPLEVGQGVADFSPPTHLGKAFYGMTIFGTPNKYHSSWIIYVCTICVTYCDGLDLFN